MASVNLLGVNDQLEFGYTHTQGFVVIVKMS